ncbi:MAG: hypothetical protein U0746_10140 [Gemmataceae bacterium]
MITPIFLTTTCDIYRPFGAASPLTTGVPCRISPGGPTITDGPHWTHTLDVQPGVDLCDGCSRTAGADAMTYADGDEVRVPSGGATRYVVVGFETVARGTPMQFQRAYLLRHSAAFPDP